MAQHNNELSQQTKGIRLPMVRTDADIDALSHLNSEEKAAAKENQRRVPPSDGWYLLGHDPELQAISRIDEIASIGLLKPDTQMVPFGPMNLICIEVGRHMGADWMAIGMSTIAINMAKVMKRDLNPAKLAVIENPDSNIWTDEERLTLKFTRACLTNTMTDEVFAQARETWGEKRLLRIIRWISYVHFWAMVQNACNLKWEPTERFQEQADIPPDPEVRLDLDPKVMEGLRSLWASMPKMGG
ncbi:MAG: hypothetical protein HKP58_01880 [Desulfatitalea sp.]|nr:hypothetical protein [Desulfatitalea sp.]NNJ99137.1 hypothetical protein [Desulfatitalea sp.]